MVSRDVPVKRRSDALIDRLRRIRDEAEAAQEVGEGGILDEPSFAERQQLGRRLAFQQERSRRESFRDRLERPSPLVPTADPVALGRGEIRPLPDPQVLTPLDLFRRRLGFLETLEAIVSPSEFISGGLTDLANRLPGIGEDRAMGPTGGGFAATVERERSRSLPHQVAGGLVDPLNAVPVVGFGPSAATIERTVGRAVEGVLEATTPVVKAAGLRKIPAAVADIVTAPPGVTAALERASNFLRIDAPGFTGRLLDRIPGIKQVQAYLRPANKIPDHIQTAFVAEGAEQARFSTKMFASRPTLYRTIDSVFGEGASTGAKTEVAFTGTVGKAESIVGTVLDIAQRPQLYDLTAPQRALLRDWQVRNHGFMQELIEQYGPKIGEFTPAEGGVFLFNVDIAEDVLKAMDASRFRAATIGRGKTRVFETAADRMKFDPKFKPETNIRSLQAAMDEWKAAVAGTEVFKQGVGGKTLIALIDELHPGLRKAKDALTAKVRALKDRIETVAGQERGLKAEAGRVRTQAKNAQQRAQPFLERIEELGEEWGPELSTLSGQARELLLRASELERRGVVLGERIAAGAGKQRALATELGEVAPQLEKLRRQYSAANLRGHQLVQDGVSRYFPADEAKIVRELRSFSNNSLVRVLEEIRGTAFAGDFSPLLGVQLPLGALFNPKQAVQQLVGAGKATIKSRDLLRIFREQTLADVVSLDLPGWQDFAFYSGIPVRSGVAQEFAGGLLRFIPGFSKANEAMYAIVLRQSKVLYDQQRSILANAGYTGEFAKALAADMATKAYPMWQPRRLGLSSARAAAIRSVPTSISFMTRPAALMAEATTGLAKLAVGRARTPQETLALRLVLTLAASWMGLSVTSAVTDAGVRGTDPWQATQDAVNPASGKFGSIIIPGTGRRLPIGGPYRGVIKAIVPREVDWAPVPVPFAGIGHYFANRLTPLLRTQVDLLRNRDFYGGEIYKGALPEKILRGVLYELEGVLPLTAGSVIGGLRRGLDIQEIGEEAAAQFGGTNLGRETPFQARDLEVQQWAEANGITDRQGRTPQSFYGLEPQHRKEFEEARPEVVESIKAETKRRADQGIKSAQRTQRSEDLKQEYTEFQEMDDTLLQRSWAGDAMGLDPAQWRERRRVRAIQLNARRDELFEGVDVKTPETPVDFYFAKFEELERQFNGVMTSEAWDELDRWVAEQSPDDQLFIEENTRLTAMTPLVQQYYDDLQLLKPYWAREEAVENVLEVSDRALWQRYRSANKEVARRIRSENGIIDQIQTAITNLRADLRSEDSAIDTALIRWGYSGNPRTVKGDMLREAMGAAPTGPTAPVPQQREPVGAGR